AGFVFFATQADGTVWLVPSMGGTVMAIATGQSNPVSLAIGFSELFWANGGGEIMSESMTSGPVVLAGGLSVPHSVRVNSQLVVWCNAGTGASDGSIMHLPPTPQG